MDHLSVKYKSFAQQGSSNIIKIKKNNIPKFLHSSELYLNIGTETSLDHDLLEFLEINLKLNLIVLSIQDLRHLLVTMRFWGLHNELPKELTMFCLEDDDRQVDELLIKFVEFIPQLGAILKIRQVPFRKDRLILSAQVGNVMIMRCLHEQYLKESKSKRFSMDSNFCSRENNIFWCEEVCSIAALYGNLECLKYAHTNGCPWNVNVYYNALNYGRPTCLKYILQSGCPQKEKWYFWKENAVQMSDLARIGFIECLRTAHESGISWDKDTCSCAAEKGYLECLKYAHENGCPWDESTCAAAAAGNHVACLKYAHEHGCPWNSQTTRCAAFHGSLECLKYAHENGCVINTRTAMAAMDQHHCLQYTIDNGCAIDDDGASLPIRKFISFRSQLSSKEITNQDENKLLLPNKFNPHSDL